MIGIYQILNVENNFPYVGKTARSIKRRFYEHKYDLKKNKDSPHLQNAWNKYGEEKFEFLILEECLVEELKEKEEYWINKLESWNPEKGYNIKRISEGIEHHSKETVEKISNIVSKRGIKTSWKEINSIRERYRSENVTIQQLAEEYETHFNHISRIINNKIWKDKEYNYCGRNKNNYIPTEKTRKKRSESRKGEKNHNYGKKMSEEQKKKISQSKKGKIAGEKNPASKLTWKQIREIREKYRSGEYLQIDLSKEYGVNDRNISKIINNVSWKE